MGTSRIMRGVTWLVVAGIALSTASPVLASYSYEKQNGGSALSSAAVQAGLPSPDVQPLAEPLASGEMITTSLAASQTVTFSQELTATTVATDVAPLPIEPVVEDSAWTTDDSMQAATRIVEPAAATVEAARDYLPPLSLQLLIDVQPGRATPGGVVTYNVNVVHTGYQPLTNIVVSDAVPPGLVYVPGSATNFGYTPRDKLLTWNVADLQPGQVLTGTFQARATGLAIGRGCHQHGERAVGPG